tara:strand:- start:161 stop:409 length:249 start_codon:yes stop_codon:yes gene_type:complete
METGSWEKEQDAATSSALHTLLEGDNPPEDYLTDMDHEEEGDSVSLHVEEHPDTGVLLREANSIPEQAQLKCDWDFIWSEIT